MFLSNTSSLRDPRVLEGPPRGRAKFSKPVTIKAVETGETLEFPSIIAIVKHFKSLDIIKDKNKIAKNLNTGESYNGYIFQK